MLNFFKRMDPVVERTLEDIVLRAEGRMQLEDSDWFGLAKCFLIDAVLFMNRRAKPVKKDELEEEELELELRLAQVKNEHPANPARADAGEHCEDRGIADGRLDDQGGRAGLVGGEDERADEQARLDENVNETDYDLQAGVYTISDELLPVEDERGEGHERGCSEEIHWRK